MIYNDLYSEKKFIATIQELEIDSFNTDKNSYEDETKSIIDEVRGVSEVADISDDDNY